jgi:uncharacterized membrane protein
MINTKPAKHNTIATLSYIECCLSRKEQPNPVNGKKPQKFESFKSYLLSFKPYWFWLSVLLVISTAILVLVIPENKYPFIYIRQAFGIIYVLFLPGFVFVKMLYPCKVPIETSSENLGKIEEVGLSFALSILFAALTGLILNYTSWGIRVVPVTISLLVLTLIFSAIGVFREYQAKVSKLIQ